MRISFAIRLCFAALMAVLLAGAATAVPARAEAPASTLKRITETGAIRIGYGDAPPFAYKDRDGTVVGYSIDICKRLSEELRQRLNLPVIKIEYVFRTASNRIQMLNDGAIDIECNASTDTPERRRSAAFAKSHFYVTARYVSLSKNKLRTLDDLRGRSVSITLGTVNVGQINKINRERKLNLSIVPSDTVQGAFDMITDGTATAYAMDDVLLSAMIARTGRPQDYAISTEVVAEPQPYGFMMRLGDTEFHDVVNAALTNIYASTEMQEIYDRWFLRTIPRDNINLNLPMSEQLKSSFRSGG